MNGGDNGDNDLLTVSQGRRLLHEAHAYTKEAIGLLVGNKKGSLSDSNSFALAVQALRRSVCAVRVIELFPRDLFEEFAQWDYEHREENIWIADCGICEEKHELDHDDDSTDSDSEVKTSFGSQAPNIVDRLRRHLVGITLTCYTVLIMYYLIRTKRMAFDFIRALDYCDDVLSVVPETGTALFDRELALLHARLLMSNCRFPESEIQETARICEMIYEEERQREVRDLGRQHYLHSIYAPCKGKMSLGG